MNEARNILLVEDNPMDVDLTRRAFARRKVGHIIDVARNGQEALDRIPRWEAGEAPPALVLLDVKLPRVGGLEVLRALRAHPRFGRLPVIMLTTSTEDGDIDAAYAIGANSYIVKPVNFDNFLDVAAQIDQYWLSLNTPPRPAQP